MLSCQDTSLLCQCNVSVYFGNIDRTVSKHFLNIADIYISVSRLVAKVCLNICGVMCRSIAASEVYLFIILRTAWSVRGRPDWFAKKWLQFTISEWKSTLYLFSIFITEGLPIWIRRSLSPLPYIRILPSYRLISLIFSAQSSEILMPVANKSSITAASLREFLLW